MSNYINRAKDAIPYTMIDNSVIEDVKVFKTLEAKVVYMYLMRLDGLKEVFPSQAKLGKIARCSDRHIRKAIIPELEELGLIEREGRPGKSDLFFLNPFQVALDKLTTKEQQPEPQKDAEQPDPGTPFRGSEVPENADPGTPFRGTPEPRSAHPGTPFRLQLLSIITNLIISSSSEGDKKIIEKMKEKDQELKSIFPLPNFEEVQERLLNDQTAIIETFEQYTALMAYRLGAETTRILTAAKKPKVPRKAKPTRVEKVPEWFNGEDKPAQYGMDIEAERKRLLEELGQSSDQ